HLIDMVAGQDQHILRAMTFDDIQILQYRIGGAFIPGGFDSLLGRQQLNKLSQFAPKESPTALNMANKRMRFVLGNHTHLANAGIDAIGQRKIDDPELASERHCGFGPPFGEVVQTAPPAPGKNQSQGLPRKATDKTLGGMHNSVPDIRTITDTNLTLSIFTQH